MENKDGILALDIGGTFIKMALVIKNGQIIVNSFNEISANSIGTLDGCRTVFQDAIRLSQAIAKSNNINIAGAGISVPGPFDYVNGMSLMKHKYQPIEKVPLRPWFKELVGDVPIEFVSDSEAYLIGQLAGQEFEDFSRICMVALGTGIGFAASVKGKILSDGKGQPEIAIYDMPYKENIAEYYIGRKGIIRRYKDKSKGVVPEIDVIHIAKLAEKGETCAQEIFAEEGQILAEVISGVIDKYAFEALIVGGQIAKSFHLFECSLKAGLAECKSLKCVRAANGIDTSALIGAAIYVETKYRV